MGDKPFVDFYDDLGFAPTAQSMVTIGSLPARRDALYRILGVPPLALRASSVLEIGPGSGENAGHLLSRGVRSLTVVEGSVSVLRNFEEMLSTVPDIHSSVELVHSDILNFSAQDRFDLVVCEGVLPLQMDPMSMVRNVFSMVAPGGVVIVTCFDVISGFADHARRLIASLAFEPSLRSPMNHQEVVQFFAQDFGYLPNMTRDPEMWVLDSIVNPWLGRTFSLCEAMTVASELGLDFLGSSPSFITRWGWYKSEAARQPEDFLQFFVQSYLENCLNLLDQRFISDAIDSAVGLEVYERFSLLWSSMSRVIRTEIGAGAREGLANEIESLVGSLKAICHPEVAASLKSLGRWLISDDPLDLSAFRPMWGRGQQYLSLTRPMI